MGNFIHKLLSELEEEEKVCQIKRPPTPICTPKHVHHMKDPRSATAGIIRTPIMIQNHSENSSGKDSELETLDCIISESEEIVRDLGQQSDSDGSYSDCKLRLLENDPRSPTLEIVRTPIYVFSPTKDVGVPSDTPKTSQPKYLETNFDVLSDEVDDNTEVKTVISDKINDNKEKLNATTENKKEEIISTIKEVVSFLEEEVVNEDYKKEEVIVPKLVPLKKKLFPTPIKETSVAKVRLPLRVVSANDCSPKNILRNKQSRGLKEALAAGDENTPPSHLKNANYNDDSFQFNTLNLSPMKPSLKKKRIVAEWSTDATVII